MKGCLWSTLYHSLYTIKRKAIDQILHGPLSVQIPGNTPVLGGEDLSLVTSFLGVQFSCGKAWQTQRGTRPGGVRRKWRELE